MASQHDNVDKVRAALRAMLNVGINEKEFARAMHYVATHEEAVADMCYDSTPEAVAVDIAASVSSCHGGLCE